MLKASWPGGIRGYEEVVCFNLHGLPPQSLALLGPV